MLAPATEPAQSSAGGHATANSTEKAGAEPGEALTMFPHAETAPWFVAGQANIIFQAHPSFHSPYQGPNSLHGAGEYKTSLLGTLYLGYQLGRGVRGKTPTWSERYNTDFIADFESSGGRGLSEALGLAGFTNLDVVRNPNLGSKPYVARVQFHQTIGFTNEMTEVDQTVILGADYDGAQWGRENDKVGLSFVSNAIKKDHQNYLADGGLGFLLGDGRLHYGRETTEEAYYNAHAWRGMFFALGLSHIDNPGYNRDRGPVWVPSLRAHFEF